MINRMATIIAAAAALTACATTYQVPQEAPPPEWSDNGEPMQMDPVQDSIRTFEGEMTKGGTLMEFEVRHQRTATIANELVWQGPFGGENRIAAGTPAYARQFSLTRTTTYNYAPIGSARNMNSLNNPIEWCVPRETDAVCIFWEGADKARYIDTNGGVALSAMPTTPSGMMGPVPIIKEGEVDFGRPLKVAVVIQDLRKDEVRIMDRYVDGEDWTGMSRQVSRLRWDENGEVIAKRWNGEFKIKGHFDESGKPTSATVTVIKAPSDIKFLTMQEAMAVFKALIAAQRAEGAAAIDEAAKTEDEGEAEAVSE
jgi:hypothetical protein